MKVDQDIIGAIHAAAAELGAQAELARRCGITNSALTKICGRRVGKISEEGWEKLYPRIRHHLPRSDKYASRGRLIVKLLGLRTGASAVSAAVETRDAARELRELSDILQPGEDDDLAGPFRVPDESMAPDIRQGDAIVLDCTMEPGDGDAVVAKLGDEVVVRRYRRAGNSVVLDCVNPQFGDVFVGHPDRVMRVARLVRIL